MLTKKYLEAEITKCEVAIEQIKNGLDINELMLAAFKEALTKCK